MKAGRPIAGLTGKMFGMWTVLRRDETKKYRNARWFCRCDCGAEKSVEGNSITRSDRSRSTNCGCVHLRRQTKHGFAARANMHELYGTWVQMVGRCHNPNHPAYAYYGGRGINVCESWRHDITLFVLDVGKRPTPQHSLDRIDNDGPYGPENVRWATKAEQQHNRRDSRAIWRAA
jgi:hypothetical protein